VATNPSPEVLLDVHGLGFRVVGDWAEVRAGLALDFAFFTSAESDPPSRTVEVEVRRIAPRPEQFEPAAASFITPRNAVYQVRDLTVIDYQGQALAIYDRRAERISVEGLDAQLVQEAAYQFVLSRIGTHLDAIRLPRLHALALRGRSGAVAVLLPSGGGKTTLALRALREDGVQLISEDTPLIGPSGQLHPFVLRMGVNPGDAEGAPGGATRLLQRMEFHSKYAVEVASFADRIAQEPQPLSDLVIGVRTLGEAGGLDRARRRSAIGPLLREGVVGVGVYQGMEFVLQRGMRDTAGKAGVAAMRARRCGSALAGARVWRLRLGRDVETNWAALRPLVV
jgi:hypothetical protein